MTKPELKTTTASLRLDPATLAKWRKGACDEGLTLSDWLRAKVDADQQTHICPRPVAAGTRPPPPGRSGANAPARGVGVEPQPDRQGGERMPPGGEPGLPGGAAGVATQHRG